MYNDGVTLLYFNTTGTKGGSEELKNFLEYLEKSEPEKAVTSATQELQGYALFCFESPVVECEDK